MNVTIPRYDFEVCDNYGTRESPFIEWDGSREYLYLFCQWDENKLEGFNCSYRLEFYNADYTFIGRSSSSTSIGSGYFEFEGNNEATFTDQIYTGANGTWSGAAMRYMYKVAVYTRYIKIFIRWNNGNNVFPDEAFKNVQLIDDHIWAMKNQKPYLIDIGGPSQKERNLVYNPTWAWHITPGINDGAPYTGKMGFIQVLIKEKTYDYIDIYDNIRVYSRPHGLDKLFPVNEITIPLNKPVNTKYKLGTTESTSLTSINNKINDELYKKLGEVPKASSILQQARDNASYLIKNATHGYVTLREGPAGVEEIIIADEPDYLTARNVWRWNEGGLGFSNTGYNGHFETAITKDGAIVADFITAGYLHGDYIRGGTILLGGFDDRNGIVKVVDADGNKVVKLREGRLEFYNNEYFIGALDSTTNYQGTDRPSMDISCPNEALTFNSRWIGVYDRNGNCWVPNYYRDDGSDSATVKDLQVVSKITYDSEGRITNLETRTISVLNGFIIGM